MPSGLSFAARLSLPALALLASCSVSTTPSSDFTVRGSAGAPPAPAHRASLAPPPLSGDPGALRIGLYALYISPNSDCSSPVLVQDYGATPSVKDFVNNPILFTGRPASGSYQCVAIKMSDVITVEPATSFGACVMGTEYAGDIYRAGDSSWKDIDLHTIIGTGTDSVPADDHVTLILTRDTTAAQLRGFDTHQVLQLGTDLIVPSQSTFYWNGQGTVMTDGTSCGVNPGQPSFQ